MLMAIPIDLVDHRGERSRFAGAGRPGDQDQAARLVAHLLDDRRKSEFLKCPDLVRNSSEDSSHGATLVENICAKARESFDSEREVELEILFESVLLRIRQHRIAKLCRSRGRERLLPLRRD